MTTGKIIVLKIQTFKDKVVSLLFNTLSRFVIVAQLVNNLLAMQETWVWFLGEEDPLATHSRRKWLPTPVFLPGESHRQRSLVGLLMGPQRIGHNWKDFCFWTMVLEKTLESPLNGKEIQPVHPKGNQSWIFIEKTDAEAETPILWPPDVNS